VTNTNDYESAVLETLRRAVAEALERKRRLGQYAVVWREGRAMCIGPDAPAVRYPGSAESVRAAAGVAEPGCGD
jgi:hypothetical protein